jgi:hypothetical protein
MLLSWAEIHFRLFQLMLKVQKPDTSHGLVLVMANYCTPFCKLGHQYDSLSCNQLLHAEAYRHNTLFDTTTTNNNSAIHSAKFPEHRPLVIQALKYHNEAKHIH